MRTETCRSANERACVAERHHHHLHHHHAFLLSVSPSFSRSSFPPLPLRRAQHPLLPSPFPSRFERPTFFPCPPRKTLLLHLNFIGIRLPFAVARDSTILLNLRLETLFHPSRHVRLSFFVRRFDDSLSKSLFLSPSLSLSADE